MSDRTAWNTGRAREGAADLRTQGDEFYELEAEAHAILDRWTTPGAPEELREFGTQVATPAGQISEALKGLGDWCHGTAANIDAGAVVADTTTEGVGDLVKGIKDTVDDPDGDPGYTSGRGLIT